MLPFCKVYDIVHRSFTQAVYCLSLQRGDFDGIALSII